MELTPQQWENVKALFESALEKTPAERSSFIARAAQDVQVRSEVERLLAHHVESGGLLSSPALAGNLSPVTSPSQSFVVGELVADRFRITRFIARGGMGEVYEAEDVELRERVALKSIRGELLHDGKVLERFKREVYLARKVTHPNVCRIFDLFRLPPKDGGGPVAFVAMELLEGETLAELLQRKSRLSLEEAKPIALQIASGLGAAHEAGVLHRDFKPGNVMLVPAAKGVRAVITDFGLALRTNQEISLATVTGPGEMLGTPAFMSPEQVEGKDLTSASDVYSLGLVLYQMLTGTRAFEGETPLSMAVRRIKEDATPPRRLVPDFDRSWELLILRCLERDPKNRYQNGDEVAAVLADLGETRRGKRLEPRVLIGIILAAVLVVAAAFVIPKIFRPQAVKESPAAESAIAARPSIAVLPFHNLSGRPDTDWVSTALPEMLTAELVAGGKLRTFPGENIARASKELGLTGHQTLARDTLTHLREYLGSDYVVLGSYLDQGASSDGQIRIDLWLQDTKTGETTATVSEKGSENNLDEITTRAGADLRQRLGMGEVTAGEAAAVKASLPSNPEAVRLYSAGLAKLRLFDALGARELLKQAVAADPNYALGHSALADAWAMAGYDQQAREESNKARDLSSGLSREERLWIEGRNAQLNRKWDKAVESYRTLFDFFPDNIDYGLHLAFAQEQARTLDEALATLATLRRLSAPIGDDPRIDMQQAEVFEYKGASKEEHAAAGSAIRRARELGAKQLLAHVLSQDARALEAHGQLDEAKRSAQEAADIADGAGERAELARALTVQGLISYDQGNFSEAVSTDNRALAIQREIGHQRGVATTLNNLANALAAQGDFSGSRKILQEAILIFRDLGDKHSATAVQINIATRTYRQGELEPARKMLQEALASAREIGDQERADIALFDLGEVLRFEGDLPGARKVYIESRDIAKQIGDESGVGYALTSLGDVSLAEGEFAAARNSYNQAIGIRTKIGENGNIAENRMALAMVQIEEGHSTDAADALRGARDEFHKEGLGDDEIIADTLLARVALAQGKQANAETEMASARNLLSKSQDFSIRLRTATADAQVQAAAGKIDAAVRGLQQTIASAEKSRYLGYELEARLALGEVEMKSGKVAAGQKMLAETQRQAQQKGFRLIASKAARGLSPKKQTN